MSIKEKILEKIANVYFKDSAFRHKVTQDFYTMLRFYDKTATNIAVIGNQWKFKVLVNKYKSMLRPQNDDKMYKISDRKYIFIINETETTVVLLNNLDELYLFRLKYYKYL